MLYDSTKNLLQSILLSLETGDETRWDDQIESGNACLYEMHQMAGPLYKAYRSDSLNANSRLQGTLPEKLNRALPYVRRMVIAIRHRDQAQALESGKAALAEMNGTSHPSASACSKGVSSGTEAGMATGKDRPAVRNGSSATRYRVASSN
jgi:hypothetical protein